MLPLPGYLSFPQSSRSKLNTEKKFITSKLKKDTRKFTKILKEMPFLQTTNDLDLQIVKEKCLVNLLYIIIEPNKYYFG